MLLDSCICECHNYKTKTINKIKCAICNQCGVIRQIVELSKREYYEFYKDEYFQQGTYSHSYAHDVEVAKIRIGAYRSRFELGELMLDIGAGNGAFVDSCNEVGIKTYGVEISDGIHHTMIYNKPLAQNYFPTDYFSTITLHDVLEHLIDPISFMDEVFRILQQGGHFIVDFPRFHHKSGKHHWKITEHLWMLELKDIVKMAKDAGFRFEKMYYPIESKEVYIFRKPKQKRVKILVPPGLGDIYWSLTKIRSFCEVNKLGIPDIYISSMNPERDRSLDFVQMVPFVNAKGYLHHKDTRGSDSKWWRTWQEAYLKNGRTIFKDVEGCDYFIAYNGIMRFGKEIDKCDTKYETDWQFPMFESIEQQAMIKEYKEQFGDFNVGYFIPHGMYKKWLEEFTLPQIKEALDGIYLATDQQTVLIGAKWDKDTIEKSLLGDGTLTLVGETTLEQCFALMKASKGVIGFPSGITFMGGMFDKNLLCLWNDYFDERFWMNCMPPKLRNKTYKVIDTKNLVPVELTKEFIDMDKKENKEVKTKVKKRPIKKNKGLTICCTYKTGGDFTVDYVHRLWRSLQRNLSKEFHFVVFTDSTEEIPEADKIVKLKHNGWRGFWSKIELFRSGIFGEDDQVIYFDLDTVLCANIDTMITDKLKFKMMESFRDPAKPASGIMMWKGDWSGMYEFFKKNPDKFMKAYKGDQEFIKYALHITKSHNPGRIDDMVEILSYKRNCTDLGPPNGSPIVCFHGLPRPHTIMNSPGKNAWMIKHWS